MINNLSSTNLINKYHSNLTNSNSQNSVTKSSNAIPPQHTRASIFYVNDLHGKMTNMERLYAIARQFDSFTPSYQMDKLKLASGDIILGENYLANRVAHNFMNWAGFSATALGNHEMDVVPEKLSELIKNAKYRILGANVTVDKNSPMNGKITKSFVEEHNGNKYGIIGIAPSDVLDRVKHNKSVEEIHVSDLESTIKEVQDEVNNFKAQGINKIILLSHSGYENDKRIAQETSGLDVILGAHTHNILENVKEGVNLITSKDGEPVVITQAGKDGEKFGVLNLEFDKDGVITKVQNNLSTTREFRRILPIKYAVENILGKPEILGEISSVPPAPKHRLIAHNPNVDIIADAMKDELGADMALLNSGNIRGNFDVGTVDSRLISDITPFKNNMVMAHVSEKELVDAIKVGTKSFSNVGNKPGIFYVSGLKYTVDTNGKLLKLIFVDKDKIEHPIDVENPRQDKFYKIAMDDFTATGGDGYFTKRNPNFIETLYDFDKDKLTCDYIKKMKSPIVLTDDRRITVVDANTGKIIE